MLSVANSDIGPKGTLRRKLLKTAFKIIIKYIAPDQPIYLGYLSEQESTATRRDLGFMKKLTKLQKEHYIIEKGFKGIETLYAICEFTDHEIGNFVLLEPI